MNNSKIAEDLARLRQADREEEEKQRIGDALLEHINDLKARRQQIMDDFQRQTDQTLGPFNEVINNLEILYREIERRSP